MSKNHKSTLRTLNYFDDFPLIISAVAGSVSISTFASLVVIPVGITSSVVRLKICVITAEIKKHKSIIKKKKKEHDKIVLLGKAESSKSRSPNL